MNKLRPPSFAGSFYPDDEDELKNVINKFLKEAKPPKINGKIKALISPHAGYPYSGPIASYGYKLIKGKKYENIIIFGPSHRTIFSNFALTNYSPWKTPLGLISTSSINKHLEPESYFSLINEAHIFEHSIEVQIPFLQIVLEDFKITPILTGNIDSHKAIANVLRKYIQKETLIIVSADLSHYLPYEEANDIDRTTIDKILKFDKDITHEQSCGADGIIILLELAKQLNWKPTLLDYRNSGDTSGNRDGVVGYTSIVFTE